MKSTPAVACLPYFSCATDFVIDPMHAVDEGVVKLIMRKWFRFPKEEKLPCRLSRAQVGSVFRK